MSEEKTTIYLDSKEAELFKKFRQFQDEWERIFANEFVGSLTIHRARFSSEIEFEWHTREKKESLTSCG